MNRRELESAAELRLGPKHLNVGCSLVRPCLDIHPRKVFYLQTKPQESKKYEVSKNFTCKTIWSFFLRTFCDSAS